VNRFKGDVVRGIRLIKMRDYLWENSWFVRFRRSEVEEEKLL
jgi:hypothetical protein